MTTPPAAVLNFVRERGLAGAHATWLPLGASGRVWQVEELIVKRHHSARAFEQELHALREWFAAARPGRERPRVPELLDCDRSLWLLVLRRLPGRSVGELDPADLRIQRAAGEFLAGLQALDIVDEDPLPLPEALALRFRAWSSACADLLESPWRATLAELEPQVELFRGERRVACHRDYSPSNWLWDGQHLAVIDFEHARPDLQWVDLAKLAVGVWQGSGGASAFAAFSAGFGRSWDDAAWQRLRVVVVLHGLACLAWGRRHGDPTFVAEGRRAMALSGDPGLGLVGRLPATCPPDKPL